MKITKSNTPINCDGHPACVIPLESLSVRQWHPVPIGEGKPEQVHLVINTPSIPAQFAVRFKSRAAIDALIMALMEHADDVFGKAVTQ